MAEKIKVDIAAMPPQYKRLLTNWVWHLLDQAMADPELWAKIQAHKEMMYRTGQLTRPEETEETEGGVRHDAQTMRNRDAGTWNANHGKGHLRRD